MSCGLRDGASSLLPLQVPTQEVVIESNPHQFKIVRRNETRSVTGRHAAVDAAKRWSERSRLPVQVKRDDDCVDMTFVRGQLDSYKYEMRRR